MKSLFTAFTVLIVFVMSSFAQQNFTVNGNLEEGTNYEYMYLEHILSGIVTDTAEVKNGKFTLRHSAEQADYYRIFGTPDEYILIIPNAGETIRLNFDSDNLNDPEVSGSEQTALFYDEIKKSRALDTELEEYQQKLTERRQEQIRKFITDNPSGLASLIFIDELDIEKDLDYYKMLADGLKNIEGNEMVDDLRSKVKNASLLVHGSVAPEIDLPTPEGDNKKLSELRGNYVLIDFWAAWCHPCRVENPNLVKAYKKYNKHGFEIYSISLDSDKDSWTAAIEADEMTDWVHVSDLMYWESEAAELYGVKAIPYNVLIDKEGKIIAKDLRGEALEEKLAEIFD